MSEKVKLVKVELDEDGVADRNEDGTALKGDKTVIGLSVSKKFGEVIADHANAQKLSMAELVRRAVANMVGYDLSSEPVAARGPRQKYNSPEEAAAAQKAKQAERNELVKRLLLEYRQKEEAEAQAKAKANQ